VRADIAAVHAPQIPVDAPLFVEFEAQAIQNPVLVPSPNQRRKRLYTLFHEP
jgi:hypothetical protein